MNISVVIPSYNRSKMVVRAIESVLAQTFPAYEILVVNDGGTDDTLDVLKNYSDKITVLNQQNKGVAAARNYGILKAKGEWVALLDSDDEWLPAKLENHRKFSRKHPEIHIFQCDEIWIRNGKKVNPPKKYKKFGGWIFEKCIPACIISPSATIFKKILLENINGFDESFPVCEDYDLWLRISKNHQIGYDPAFGIVRYGGHDDQLSTGFSMIDKFRIKALEKHITDTKLSNEIRAKLQKEILYRLNILIKGTQKRGQSIDVWNKLIEKYKSIKY